ncbi:MAG: molybdate ABC transporter substrate-binding protein [Gammaproteobacteria bacterium]|nr:MAG: molybdate ABC transporter substrate-binding protein [Gammaproteobacteria bacterium]
MRTHALCATLLVAVTTVLVPGQTTADEIRVAVASNFTDAMGAIAERFETGTGHKVTLISGSTGKHYAQIRNGAPFDAFFAADRRRPELLEEEGVALPGTRFTYAVGKLVLWSPERGIVDPEAVVLQRGEFHHLAIANPKLAPYGKAAEEVLQARGLWARLSGRLVRGENIGQAFQFVKSGNAELGFVAYSQLKRPNQPIEGSLWNVPQALYTPIEQQAVLLKDSEAARSLLSFVRSDAALMIIRDYGYETP